MMRRCDDTDKERYDSEASAHRALRRIQRTTRGHRTTAGHKIPRRAYKCQFCGGWHLTSEPFRR